jgi:outer membrane protein assembly factor BamB
LEGGGIWGAATDERTVYTNIANSNRERFTLAPSNQTTTVGAWVALDANSGQILWSTANPSNEAAQGPVTIVNDVLFAGSVAPNGPIYAMDAKTGNILWSYNTGATVYGGVSASYGCIYLGWLFNWPGKVPPFLDWWNFTLCFLRCLISGSSIDLGDMNDPNKTISIVSIPSVLK